MTFHRSIVTLLALGLTSVCVADAHGQFGLNSKKRRQQQWEQKIRNTPVELTENSGPWLIMCASFVGEEAEMQAHQLVRELRNEYGLLAYTYSHHFDYSNVQGLGYDPEDGVEVAPNHKVAKPLKMKALHDSSFDEIAVLVGDYPSFEDAIAQKHLEGIKYLMPESLGKLKFGVDAEGEFLVRPEQADTQRMRTWRAMNKAVNANADKRKGPMGQAFLLPNPTLPDEYFTAHTVDDFVLDMNRRFKHSLLDNDGIFTVRIATFRGDSTFELDQIQENTQRFKWNLQRGKSIKESKLAIAMAQAHRLTMELRKLGIAAYEFHDRHESYVCIGSFDWLKRGENGNEYQNPEIVELIEVFKGRVENFPGVQGAVRPKSLSDVVRAFGIEARKLPNLAKLGVVFDVQPIPVQVPRAERQVRTARGQGNRLFR